MRESMKRHLVSAGLGLATAVLLVLMVEAAFGQTVTSPVPIRPIVRPAYVEPAPAAPQAPAGPGAADWRPTVRPAPDQSLLGGPPARLRYVPLPGSHACSLAPGGREVCGAGVWIVDREESR